jgi:hypothetical protein
MQPTTLAKKDCLVVCNQTLQYGAQCGESFCTTDQDLQIGTIGCKIIIPGSGQRLARQTALACACASVLCFAPQIPLHMQYSTSTTGLEVNGRFENIIRPRVAQGYM